MAEKMNCWDFFNCAEKDCPVVIQREPRCWLVSGTFCRNEIQGLFIEKIEMCLECEYFKQSIDPSNMQEVCQVVGRQFKEITRALRDRDAGIAGHESGFGHRPFAERGDGPETLLGRSDRPGKNSQPQ